MIFGQNLDFESKCRFQHKIWKICMFEQNLDNSPKFELLAKILIFLVKVLIFGQISDFWRRFRFLAKISVFDQTSKFRPIFDFLLSKVSILQKFDRIYVFLYQDGLYKSVLSGVEGFRSWLSIPSNEPVTSVLFGGFVGSLFSLLQFLNAPILGALSGMKKNIPFFKF